MRETQLCAIARYTKRSGEVRMAMLSPFEPYAFMTDDKDGDDEDVGAGDNLAKLTQDDALLLLILPFSDDVREWQFRPLPLLSQLPQESHDTPAMSDMSTNVDYADLFTPSD